MEQMDCLFDRMFCEAFFEADTSEQRPEQNKESSHAKIWGKSVPYRRRHHKDSKMSMSNMLEVIGWNTVRKTESSKR